MSYKDSKCIFYIEYHSVNPKFFVGFSKGSCEYFFFIHAQHWFVWLIKSLYEPLWFVRLLMCLGFINPDVDLLAS